MRLDLYLKITRLVPRRSAAKDLCDSGSVSVNGQPAKAGREVHQGDRIELRMQAREFTAEVLGLPTGKSASRAAAREFYRVLEERRFDLLGNELPPR